MSPTKSDSTTPQTILSGSKILRDSHSISPNTARMAFKEGSRPFSAWEARDALMFFGVTLQTFRRAKYSRKNGRDGVLAFYRYLLSNCAHGLGDNLLGPRVVECRVMFLQLRYFEVHPYEHCATQDGSSRPVTSCLPRFSRAMYRGC